MAIGTSLLSLLGTPDPRQQLLQSIVGQSSGGAQYADQQAAAPGTTTAAGGAAGTPDPQPEGMKSPPDLAAMYNDMMKYQARTANIDRGFALIGGAVSQEDNRANVMNAFMPGGNVGQMVTPEEMAKMAQGLQAQQQARTIRAANLAALPSIAKRYGLDMATARMMFESGKLDELIKDAEKPDRTTATDAQGRIVTVDQRAGSQIGEALGPTKPRETRSFTDAQGQQRTIYVDDGTEVGAPVGPTKPRETITYQNAEGQQVVAYKDTGQVISTEGPQSRTNDRQNYDSAFEDFVIRNPGKANEFPSYDTWLQRKNKDSATKIDMKAESAEQGKIGGYWGEQYTKIQQTGQAAAETLSNYDIIQAGLDSGVKTGALGESEQSVRKLGQYLGIGDAENAEKVAGGELIQKIGNKMALLMRNPDSGMGMPGSLSDKDLAFLKESQLGLGTTAAGNKVALEVFRRMEERKIKMAEEADKWMDTKGSMQGFSQHWREWSKANPMFTDIKVSDYVPKDDKSAQVNDLVKKYRKN